ncbi:hypothetical protein BCV72DRAFT_221871 [Rhizopus microsporus var. microsporus]|uniref:BHLH domain-containing protein n=1 Tax=Rhizopus microsporus var. microsporus TaxID=86635 RepID=A0A1X0RDN9_RHIZD|nr:hypothetical protein BCV72DRAFT_221871 [Rhizopus microsporus var. microsporus]
MTNNINHHSNNNNNGLFSVPQLTPDGHQDNSFTGSSVLSGHNPEYNMSPLQINNHAANYTPIQHPLHNQTIDDFGDEEEFLTPLVSPAMAPTYNNNYHFNTSTDNIFSPLTSPALHPSSSVMDQHLLQQKLALIERQQQQLRSMQHQLNTSSTDSPTTSPLVTYSTESRKKSLQPKITAVHSPQTKLGLVKKIPESSPLALGPSNNNSMMAPATPSLLMKLGAGNNNNNSTPPTSTSSPLPSTAVDNMPVLPAAILQDDNTATNKTKAVSTKRRRISQTKFSHSPGLPPSAESPAGLRPLTSPRTLKPLISPSLKPNGQRLSTIDEEVARTLLTTKSNYENLKEGNVKSLGLDFSTTIQSGIEHRRSAHKAAEQKRRDILKQSFDSLRTEITEAMIEEELAEDQHMDQAELRNNKEKDVKQMSKIVLLQHSYEYIVRLKSDNKRKDEKMKNMKEEIMSLRKQLGLPEITKEEQEQEEKERQEEKEKRQERLKRLQQQTASITHNNNAIINNEKK